MVARARLTWWAAFAVFALIGITWALSIAPMGAPDEISHSRRAVAAARGQLVPATAWVETATLRVPQSPVDVPRGYGKGFAISNDQTQCWTNYLRFPTSCAPRPDAVSGPLMRSYTYVGAYQPGYYFLVGLPSRWLPPSKGIYAMRIVSALLVAALLAWAVVSVADLARGPWVVVGAAAALTPTVLFLSGSINPNGVEIAASMAVWTSLLALITGSGPAPPRLLARVGVAAAVLASTRPTSPVLLVVIVGVVLAFGAERRRLSELWASSRFRVLAGAVGTFLVANLVFVVANQSLSRVIEQKLPDASHAEVVRQALERTPGWLDEALGSLAWLGYGAVQLPVLVRWLWWGTIAVVVVVGLIRATIRQRAVVAVLVVGCVAGPIAASVLKPTVAWQGRYALPLIVGIPVLAGLAADRPSALRVLERWVASGLLVVIAACQVAAHQQLMVRNLLGLPSRLLRGILHAPWGGPLTPLVLLVLAGLGSLGFLALGLAGIWRGSPRALAGDPLVVPEQP